MVAPHPLPAPPRAASGVVIGLATVSIVIALFTAAVNGGWLAFSSADGNASAGYLLLILVPLGWVGVFIALVLGVIALIVAGVKRASTVIAIVAVVIAVGVIVAGIAAGFGQFLVALGR